MPFDERTRKLAEIAVRYSVNVKPNEKIIISGGIEAIPFLIECLINLCYFLFFEFEFILFNLFR